MRCGAGAGTSDSCSTGRLPFKVRILLLITRLDYGGAENYVVDLANALARAGHRVIVAARRGRRIGDLEADVEYRWLPFVPPLRPLTVAAVRRIAKTESVDVIHAHQREPTLVGALACEGGLAPLVATLHSRVDWDFDLPWVRQAIARLFVPSEAWLARVARLDGSLADRCVVVPNGLTSARIENAARSRCRVLYASRIDRFHGQVLRLLIREAWPEVVRRFPRCELRIAGDGPCYGTVCREARRVNRQLGRQAVCMLGYCSDLDRHLADAGLVLGVGRVALEAAGQGAPVLLVNHEHLGPLLRPTNAHLLGRNNFVPVHSPPPAAKRLAAGICRILESYNHARVDAEVLSLVVRSRYDHRRFVPIVQDGYQAAIEAGVAQPFLSPQHGLAPYRSAG